MTAIAQEQSPVLEMRHISKTFVGLRVLKNVSFNVKSGEVHALMGENGAGKSTLMKVLSGAYTADAGGEIRIAGEPVTIDGPLTARRLGVSIIYQELSLAPNLTVAENIFLGSELSKNGSVDRRAMAVACMPILARLGVSFTPRTMVSSLSMAERQLVEIARALHARSRILVMDEPTTSLSSRETDKLFDLIRSLRAEGLAIIYISHRMGEIYELSDRVTVLRDGGYVGTLERKDLSAERLVQMMVGRDLSSFYKKEDDAHQKRGRIILSVCNMGDGRRVRNCSFDLHEGEVLGIAGLVGAGRTEFARLIYGADQRLSGTVELDGKPVSISTPQQSVDVGIVYLTEDRKQYGLFLDMSVRENINVGVIGRDSRFGGILNLKAAVKRSAEAIKVLGIRVVADTVNVGALSGGNQQKVLLSRLIETKPRVLILDEPTRGVDIGAKSEIYKLINSLVKSRMGVIVISSDLPEVVGICVTIAKGAEAKAKQINPKVKILTASADYDLGKQFTEMDNFIAAGVDLILLNAADPKAIEPAVKRAQAAGLVVVAIDVAAKGADATVQTNNVQAGEIACKFIVDKLGGKGDVIIENGPQVSAVIDRVNGCKAVFAKAPGIKILSDDQDAKGSREGGLNVTQGYLTRFPKIDAMFTINDPQAIGTDLAAKQLHRTGIVISSVDGAPDIEAALKADTMIDASASQDPYAMAQQAVDVGYGIMNGKKPENPMVLMPSALVTRDNVKDYKGWSSPR